jgi:hypothetical protein
MKLMRRIAGKTRFQGDKLLALVTLTYSADEDGLYWPTWNVNDAYVQRGGVYAMIRALEQAGEIARVGTGRSLRFWIVIAFTPREMKEIAMRRLQMTDREAAVFVSGIVSRQLS